MRKTIIARYGLYVIVSTMLNLGFVTAQIGGPYTVDDNTMLLMHFDGDLTNESLLSADGEFQGDASNFYFLANSNTDLGQVLRIDNDSSTDSAFVTVADTAALDLTGNWTIEGWINIFTFGEGPSDWRWVPRLVIKTGDEVFWRPNYFTEMWGSTRFFSCGYHTASQDAWPQANSPDNTMVPGTWYHMAFVRDTTKHILMTIIHNEDSELVAFAVSDYLSFGSDDPTPITTDQPLHIGYAGGGGDSYLDGFVDEIRISNVVREFPIPPIITGVTELSNQESSATSYEVGASIFTLFSTTVETATLYYRLNGGDFQSVEMTSVTGDSMSAAIPQQASGSVVSYYLKAVDNDGLSFTSPATAETDSSYYLFGIYTPATMTLALDFDEGQGLPQDASSYAHAVSFVGNPTFSTDAVSGSHSIYLEGDSSYLEVDSPFLAAETLAVDFWFKADTIKTYCRIFNRPGSPESWYTNNYQIRTNDMQQLQAISDGSVDITTDITISPDHWYHVIYEVQNAPAGDTSNYYGVFQLSDESGLLFQDFGGFDDQVLMAMAPLRIGKAGTATGADAYPPFFKGYYDEVSVYNYPAVGLDLVSYTMSTDDDGPSIPGDFRLSQNYPNPFNPSSKIEFTTPISAEVKLNVYNLLGEELVTLYREYTKPGTYTVKWNGRDVDGHLAPSGVYMYRVQVGSNFHQVKKMVLVR